MKTTRCHTLTRLLLSCLLLLLLTVTVSAADTVASGNCGAEGDGSNLTWTLDSDGVLTISGSGRMEDYYYNGTPWVENKESIKKVAIGEDVVSIGNNAFERCTSLTNINISEGVMSIGEQAFRVCSSITSITIPDSVTSIGADAFSGCSSLESVTIGKRVTSIGERAFSICENLEDVYITDMDAWCRIGFENSSATPMCYAKNIYLNGNKIVSVDVPQGVTEIKDYTFYGFKDLIRVTILSSVTSIGRYAFSNCTSLTSITIPDSVTSIGGYVFSGCTGLTSVTIPNSVTSIGDNTFERCTSLTNINIPDSVTSIGGNAFYKCSSLISITIPHDVTSIGDAAFCGCSSLTSVNIPDGVTSIGGSAFYNCSSLTSITIPDGVTSIGYAAFCGCSSLTSVNIPNGVTSIGDRAFSECSRLTSITIPSSVTSIGEEAFKPWLRNRLTSVFITDVAAWCCIDFGDEEANPLYYAKNLYVNGTKAESLEIPEGVQVISSNAFINAECIKRVALPKSLVGIAANAFSGCRNIERVYYAGSESEWNALLISAGNDSLKNAQIYYNSTLDDYYCRIRVKVSDGGRIYVDRNTAEEGNTVTVTAAPYAGYELDAIYVDGAEIEGNTFTVTGNHEVSAAFTKLPAYGGTQDYRLEEITVQTTAGEKLQELAREKLLVSVSVRHMQGTDEATVMLAQYDAEGRYQGLVWLTLDEMPLDMALKVTLPVDNSDGKIVNLKAFVVGSILSPAPVGSAVSFGDV